MTPREKRWADGPFNTQWQATQAAKTKDMTEGLLPNVASERAKGLRNVGNRARC